MPSIYSPTAPFFYKFNLMQLVSWLLFLLLFFNSIKIFLFVVISLFYCIGGCFLDGSGKKNLCFFTTLRLLSWFSFFHFAFFYPFLFFTLLLFFTLQTPYKFFSKLFFTNNFLLFIVVISC